MLVLTNKILKCLSENIENENFYFDNIENEIVISFKSSNEKLRQKEIKHFRKNENEKLNLIRGVVEIKTLISNDFGFPKWKIYFSEKNVSFGRFIDMVENFESNDFSERFSENNNMDLFFSY